MSHSARDRVNTRRSTRIALSIPVEISFVDEEGNASQEHARTLLVNKHGAKLRSRNCHQPGSPIYLLVPFLQRGSLCRVVWCSKTPDAHGYYEVGIELERAENLWHVPYPPQDWEARLGALSNNVLPFFPTACDERETDSHALPDNLPVEEFPGTMRRAINALVRLLEKKQIFKRGEFQEGMQQMR